MGAKASEAMPLLAQWAYGYCAARGYPPPEPALDGHSLWFAVGKPDQVGRYVLVDQGLDALEHLRAPNIYVEIAGSRDRLAPLIPRGWHLRDPAFLMVRGRSPCADRAVPPPEIVLERNEHARSVEVLARAQGGALAARGVTGLVDGCAVYDQIVTEPEFRRRGLGSLVMSALMTHAANAGATQHLLIATGNGRALYSCLGWDFVTDVVSIIARPDA